MTWHFVNEMFSCKPKAFQSVRLTFSTKNMYQNWSSVKYFQILSAFSSL